MSTHTQTSPAATPSATEDCIHIKPDENGYVPLRGCGAIWLYNVSFAGAVTMTVLFGLTMTIHAFQAFHYRKKFCWVIIMGAAWEVTSFVLRAVGAKDQQNVAMAVVSQILLLLAPLWVNAFDYMVVARMVHFILPEHKIWRIRATKISKIFVWLDVISFFIQAAGSSIFSNPDNSEDILKAGENVYIGGIALQLFFLLTFIGLTITLHRNMIQLESKGLVPELNKYKRSVLLLIALYTSMTLIVARTIFRMVEFSSGVHRRQNSLPYTESYMYGLDATPIFLALVTMNVIHPGRILVGPNSEFPKVTRAEKKAEKQRKREVARLAKEEKKQQKEARKQKVRSWPKKRRRLKSTKFKFKTFI